MKIPELRAYIAVRLRRPEIVNINNEQQYVDETFNIDSDSGGWRVYHFEKGGRSFEKFFANEDDAVEYLICMLRDSGQFRNL